MATKTQTSSFDFDAYNALMNTANSGLRLFLAERMLQDVQATMVRYRSPLVKDITDIVDELTQLRDDNKKYLATRNDRGTDDTALTPKAHSNSADAGKVA
jgi:hypothetical protein